MNKNIIILAAAAAGAYLLLKGGNGDSGSLFGSGDNGQPSGTILAGIGGTPSGGSTATGPAPAPSPTYTSQPGYTPQSFGSGLAWNEISDKIKADMAAASSKKTASVGNFGTPSNPNTNPSYVYAVQQSKTPTISSYAFGGTNYHDPVTPLGQALQAFNVQYTQNAIKNIPATPQSTTNAFMNKVSVPMGGGLVSSGTGAVTTVTTAKKSYSSGGFGAVNSTPSTTTHSDSYGNRW